MASRLSTRVLRCANLSSARRQTCSTERTSFTRCLGVPRCYSSEATSTPPLLAKLKGDLKTAMRAKDATRLAVLRSVLAATLNASKTASPIRTDAQLVALLRRTARTSQEAASEFRAAAREDLAEKEEAQLRVLEEYAAGSGVQGVSEAELRDMVMAVREQLAAEGVESKAFMGEAMKKLLAPGGPLDGKDFEKTEVVKIVKEMAKA
ncbi:Yqey-like protein-domain-containing protein [Diplogelasinospora grovesii]|uniref:Altered inheritance of mitochondria protein 41 n=1 Tax=Diplogelasinospora grovesii TaxID=303347 RepID=A0AAN6N9J4_9PEZI|nr:Yqey-like protein-domain-containing protein [Diplogelasinospora grovesii]